MDNENLQKAAVELQEVAIEHQPLSYAKVIAEDEDERQCLRIEFMLLLQTIVEKDCLCKKPHLS